MVVQLLLLLALASPAGSSDSINPVIGDVSWVNRGAPVDETARIVTHLRFVHAALARRSDRLSPSQQQRRSTALATLERYIARGQFPRRTADHYLGRRPRFIDDRGVHCAVGYLVAESEPALARSINEAHEYDYVRDMADPRLLAWAKAHGFTIDELAMIQPTYGGTNPPSPSSIEREIEQSKEQMLLACARKHQPLPRVELHITGDKRGRATATTKSTDPFARCFAERASMLEQGSHNDFNSAPVPFELDLTLKLPTPQSIFEKRYGFADVTTYCTPRPGPIPDRAKVEIAILNEGPIVLVTTTPSNSEIDDCIEERTRRYLDPFIGIAGLSVEREFTVVSRLATDKFRWDTQITARSVAMGCYADKPPTVTIPLTISAKRDDADFTIDITSRNKKLTACIHERLPPLLRRATSVTRQPTPGKAEWYFRIDTDINLTVPIILTKPTAEPEPKRPRMRDPNEVGPMF